METSSSSDSSVTTFSPQSRPSRSQGLGYQKIYVRHSHSQSGALVARAKSISRPSPPRAKSVGNFPASRAQSFSSLYESSRSVGNLSRPLRTSLSSHGIFFTETGHVPRQTERPARLQSSSEAPLSMSLQDLQR